MEKKKEGEGLGELPAWTNFICPSCGIAYGINALIKAVKKRKMWQHPKPISNLHNN
jgi:hypothetical protein